MYDPITDVKQAMLNALSVIVAIAMLSGLSACAPTTSESWHQDSYSTGGSGAVAVGVLGPSGPIGP